jgi:hypothetical protein
MIPTAAAMDQASPLALRLEHDGGACMGHWERKHAWSTSQGCKSLPQAAFISMTRFFTHKAFRLFGGR